MDTTMTVEVKALSYLSILHRNRDCMSRQVGRKLRIGEIYIFRFLIFFSLAISSEQKLKKRKITE